VARTQLVKEIRTFSWTDLPFLAFIISGIFILPGCLLSLIALREAPLEYQRLTTIIFIAWLAGSLLISGPTVIVSWRRKERNWSSVVGPVLIGIMSSGLLSAGLTIGVNWIGSLFQSPTQIIATAWREPGETRVAYIKLDGSDQTTWSIPDFQARGLRDLPIAPGKERLLLNCRRGLLGIHHIESAWPLTEQPNQATAPRPLAEDEE
jgi:hypothetical protein